MRIVVGMVSFVAVGLGALTSAVLGAVLAPPNRVLVTRAELPPAQSPGQTVQAYLDTILGRNLFDPSRIGTPPGGPQVAVGSLSLLGTAVTDPQNLSSALIADTSADGLPDTYSVGYTVGDRQLVAIRYGEVELRAPDGTIEILRCATTTPGGPAAEPAEDGRIPVSRALLGGLDPTTAASLARAQIHLGPDHTPDGVRLAAIREGTLPWTLGLRNGDVVHAVDGHPLTSVADGMAAWAALQNVDAPCVDVTRRGKEVHLCYTLE